MYATIVETCHDREGNQVAFMSQELRANDSHQLAEKVAEVRPIYGPQAQIHYYPNNSERQAA